MAGTVHTEAYRELLRALIHARCEVGLSQAQLAGKLGKPASFVGKYELGERRLDVIEFLVVMKVLDRDVQKLVASFDSLIPHRL